VAADEGPQADRDPVPDLDLGDVPAGRAVRRGIRVELMTPEGDLFLPDTYNKMFTMHGVVMVFFFLIPSIAGGARQLPDPADDRGEGPGVPAHQPAQLVHLRGWARLRASMRFLFAGGVDTGWTFYTPYSSFASNTNVVPTALGVFISGLLVDPDGPELHRHDPPDARARA
jgi:cytochrome c oxidase subunit I